MSWLLLLNKRGMLVLAPFRTKPGGLPSGKKKICRKQTNKALLLVCCLCWTQVSISKCVF